MAPERPSTPVDWRPYALTAVALGLAITLNAWTQNGLWMFYSLTGAGVFLVLVALVRNQQLQLPSKAVWMVGVGAGLHYIGGSMAGLHQIGGPNGLYYALPWWDNVVHFLGSWAVGVAAVALLAGRVTGPWWLAPFLATCVAATVGAVVELYEFVQFVTLGTVDQGFYTNTLLDLYYNLLGGAAGAFLYARASVTRLPEGAPVQPSALRK